MFSSHSAYSSSFSRSSILFDINTLATTGFRSGEKRPKSRIDVSANLYRNTSTRMTDVELFRETKDSRVYYIFRFANDIVVCENAFSQIVGFLNRMTNLLGRRGEGSG